LLGRRAHACAGALLCQISSRADLLIGIDGSVKDVRVENGLPILAQAAIDAVKQWRYKPYMIDGEPVEVDSRITINFKLSAS